MMGRVVVHTWEALDAIGTASLFAVAAYLLNAGSITIGAIYLIFHYTGLLSHSLLQITYQLEDLQRAVASIERVDELFHTSSKIQDGQDKLPATTPLTVEFKNVSFGYAASSPILKDISFYLRPGAVLGLLGRTGSGKTTLTRLLFRFYDPDQGTICLNGMDIRQVRLSSLRQYIGFVTQDVQLFHASIRDNLTFFESCISDEQILQAIRSLELWAWFRTLPQGLDTVLAPGGGGLSAGEAQLLALTRIFLKNPALVILDEASSRLDPATERLIESAIERLLQNRTGIVIAHRLATLARADEIMILDNGIIREHDQYRRLAADPTSHFYALLQTGLDQVLA
jgi:ATP-binding cassette subfamily B protein